MAGISPLLSLTFAAEIGEIPRFPLAREAPRLVRL
jgi:hypothetical protein